MSVADDHGGVMRAGSVVERDEPARTVGRPPNVLHRQAEPNVVAQPKPVGVGLQGPLGLLVAGKVGIVVGHREVRVFGEMLGQ